MLERGRAKPCPPSQPVNFQNLQSLLSLNFWDLKTDQAGDRRSRYELSIHDLLSTVFRPGLLIAVAVY